MKIIDEILDRYVIEKNFRLEDFYNREDVLMFDIETTGLSKNNSFIYLIGLNYYKDGDYHITLLFNDDGISESEILYYFMDFITNYKVLMHFNGDGFDIPFVSGRIDELNRRNGEAIVNNFHLVKSVDLLKLVRPFKKALGLPNIKQKTVEKYLGINRIDMYDGGQMIAVYMNYLSMRRYAENGYEENGLHERVDGLKQLFIQHNRDDMEGMYHLTSIFAIKALSEGRHEALSYSIEGNEELKLKIDATLSSSLPVKIESEYEGIRLKAEGDKASLEIPILIDTLRFYFTDSRSGYAEESGFFVRKPKDCELAAYRAKPRDRVLYMRLDDSILGSETAKAAYYKSVIYHMLRWK